MLTWRNLGGVIKRTPMPNLNMSSSLLLDFCNSHKVSIKKILFKHNMVVVMVVCLEVVCGDCVGGLFTDCCSL